MRLILPYLFKEIRGYKNSEEKRRLVENFFSLSFLQIANYLFPLITLPYIVRVLGVEYFGLLSFATAVVGYFQILTDYGFNLTATREISINKDNRDKVVEVFSSVMIIKLLLSILGFVLLLLLVSLFEKDPQNRIVFYLTYTNICGHILLPVWLFQGMEKMKFITYLSIVSKAIFTISIFLFIKTPEDYYLVPVLTTIGHLTVGIVSLAITRWSFNIIFRSQKPSILIHYLVDGWHIFMSSLATSMYTMSTVVLLGVLTNNLIVGYYSAAEKIINAIKGLISPIAQTLFPFINRQAIIAKETALKHLRILVLFFGSVMLFISLFLLLFSGPVVNLVLGRNYENSIIVFRILALVPFLVTLDTFLGTLTMIVFDRKKQYSKIIIFAGVLNLFLASVLIHFFNHVGAAISVVIVELLITIRMFLYVQKNDLKIFR